ncbi:MAG TPA: 30S ribosomal protein S18 [Phycisphaerae bacterium]|nr:30S ribosomal protein S18 [Phycisphaerae bacterium]
MARKRGPSGGGKGRGRGKATSPRRKRTSRFREQAKCRFCRLKVEEVDYKDIGTLVKLTTQQGKIFSRKRSGNCARHQRSSRRAIKRARMLALMPYVS